MTIRRKRRKARRMKTHRIYYNEPGQKPLWWTVKVTDAPKGVVLNGTLADALAGKAGSTVGCHLSICAQRNKNAFPHPVLFAAFTKSVCLIIDEVKNGRPHHAWRYFHHYGDLVDLNDTDKNKKLVKERPELAERVFRLEKPWKPTARIGDGRPTGDKTHAKRGEGPKQFSMGAMGRAVKAGLIDKPIADALTA